MNTLAVYTANIGAKDILREPLVVSPDADYIYFTDQPFTSDIWDIRPIKSIGNPTLQSRWYFDQSCWVMSEYDYTVMHGANSQLTIDPWELIDYLADTDIAAFSHPLRDCVYEEARACRMYHKGNPDVIDSQMAHYADMRYPHDNGLSACILLVRHQTPTLALFEAHWFSEVLRWSRRDQLSFDYVRWLMDVPVTYLPGDPFESDIMRVHRH